MLVELFSLIILLVLSAFFSAAETSLTALSKHQLHHLKQKKVKGIKSVLYLRENPGVMLATILIGNNLANIAIASLATLLFLDFFLYLKFTGQFYITPLTTLATALVVLVLGEVLPKTLALSYARRVALFAAPIIKILTYLFKPLVFILNRLSNFCLKILGGHPLEKGALVTEEEILALIEAGQESGSIAKEEKTMLRDVIRFGDTLVGEVMTPLDNVIAVNANASLAQLLVLSKNRIHSRIPVFSGKKADIYGLIYLKDLIFKINEIADPAACLIKDSPDLIRKPFIVYIDQKTTDILKQLRFHKVHIAIVKNREEKTVGLVTIEDMLEEIVGEIKDEYENN